MVETYILNTDNLDDQKLFENKLETVNEERRKKVLRLPKESRKLSLGAGLLIQEFVGKVDSYSSHGKPLSNNLEFNVSHSGKYVVLSVGTEPVGVDIEIMQRGRKRIASRFFSLEECIQIDQSYDCDKTFTRLWTLKEAFLKCIGTGIDENINKFTIDLNGGNIKIKQNINNNIYYFKEYSVEGYQLSVCCEDNRFSKELTDVTKQLLL